MPRKTLVIFSLLVLSILGLSGWIFYREIKTSQNAFLTGAPPDDIKNALLPETINLSVMRPPALRVTDPIRYGNVTSVASIIVFGDFECETCKTLNTTLEQTLPKYHGKIRLVWRDLPVSVVNPNAMSAAIFARCAGAQGKFWEAHDALYAAPSLNESTYLHIADQLRLNSAQLSQCRQDPAIKLAIANDVETARNDGVNAAPLTFIGTTAHLGPLTSQAIDAEIATLLTP